MSFSLPARANVYVIRDKQGNIIRVSSQHQIPEGEQGTGCTITILIEDQLAKKQYQQTRQEEGEDGTPTALIAGQSEKAQPQPPKQEKTEISTPATTLIADQIAKLPAYRSKFKYTFKEKIDWEKVHTAAHIIEQNLKNGRIHELEYPVYQVLATAYTPDSRCCAPFDDGFTATGYPAGYGSIAIDPNYGQFRYGDVLYVEGYGLGVADDCGSAIKGKRIDVCFNMGELKTADKWGRKYVRVWKIN